MIDMIEVALLDEIVHGHHSRYVIGPAVAYFISTPSLARASLKTTAMASMIRFSGTVFG
jgi:hypothetical protein